MFKALDQRNGKQIDPYLGTGNEKREQMVIMGTLERAFVHHLEEGIKVQVTESTRFERMGYEDIVWFKNEAVVKNT